MIEAWADEGALDSHAAAPAFTGFAARFGALLAEAPALERLAPIG